MKKVNIGSVGIKFPEGLSREEIKELAGKSIIESLENAGYVFKEVSSTPHTKTERAETEDKKVVHIAQLLAQEVQRFGENHDELDKDKKGRWRVIEEGENSGSVVYRSLMARAKGEELAFIIPKPVRNKDVFLSKGVDFIVADIREVMEKDGFDPDVKEVIMAFVGKDFDNAVVRQRLLPKYRPLALKNAEERRFAMEHTILRSDTSSETMLKGSRNLASSLRKGTRRLIRRLRLIGIW